MSLSAVSALPFFRHYGMSRVQQAEKKEGLEDGSTFLLLSVSLLILSNLIFLIATAVASVVETQIK